MPSLLQKLLDQTDPTASMKHAAYGLGVVCSAFWLSWDVLRRPISPEWVACFALFLGAVVTAKALGTKDGVAASPAVSGASAPNPGDVSAADSDKITLTSSGGRKC